jgi:chaperone required for assembly of F1-ATPase
MTGGWAAKRFWNEARAEPCEGGFTVRLDSRPVKTPAKAPLVVPTLAMAQAIAAEWDAQTGKVDPATMPCTRAANSAIDKLSAQQAEVVDMLAAYAETDLLCHRAEGPPALVARQAVAWDPLLDWAAQTFGARLAVGTGVLPVPQDAGALAALRAPVAALTRFELAAFHDLVALSGSLVLGLAVIRGRMTAAEAWEASRVDETWQIEQWGADEEAAAAETFRRTAFDHAGRFFALCR